MGPLCRYLLFSAFALPLLIEPCSGISIEPGKRQRSAHKTKVSFKSKVRTVTYSDENAPCILPLAQIIAAIKDKVPGFDEETISCNGDEVSFVAEADTAEAEVALEKIFKECTTAAGHEGCLLGNGVYFEKGSVKTECSEEEKQVLQCKSSQKCGFYHGNLTCLSECSEDEKQQQQCKPNQKCGFDQGNATCVAECSEEERQRQQCKPNEKCGFNQGKPTCLTECSDEERQLQQCKPNEKCGFDQGKPTCLAIVHTRDMCTPDKKIECAEISKVCDNSTGTARCEARPVPQACRTIQQNVCEKLRKRCIRYDDTALCVDHVPTWCTGEKVDECRAYLKVCDDSNGIAKCVEVEDCSPEEKDHCWKQQKECERRNGEALCKEPRACSEKSQFLCNKLGKKCVAYYSTHVCVEHTPTKCSLEQQEQCRKYMKVCDDSSGIPQCVDETELTKNGENSRV